MQGSAFSAGAILWPMGHLALSGDTWDCDNWGKSVSSGQRPGMLRNLLQGTGQPCTTKNCDTTAEVEKSGSLLSSRIRVKRNGAKVIFEEVKQ